MSNHDWHVYADSCLQNCENLIEEILEKGVREDYPEDAMVRYLKQFVEPWKSGRLDFYKYEGRKHHLWTSKNGDKKAIMMSQRIYAEACNPDYDTWSDVALVKRLVDAGETLAEHGDFAKLMPTVAMRQAPEIMQELRCRGHSQDEIDRMVDTEHRIKKGLRLH